VTSLKEDFEDPLVLGEHPAMAIIAKNTREKVCVCWAPGYSLDGARILFEPDTDGASSDATLF
jgi:hypothetical protein